MDKASSEQVVPPALNIILRTCDHSSVHNRERFIKVPKRELIARCLRSLIASMNLCPESLVLRILDDHSSAETLALIRDSIARSFHPAEIVPLRETGNPASLAESYRMADQYKNLIYFVEDDYLHYPGALPEMLAAYRFFSAKLGSAEVAIAPYDSPWNYYEGADVCRIVPGQGRPWRTHTKTTATVLITPKTLATFRSTFDALSRYGIDPSVTEASTINQIWKRGVTLFTPIPALAFHMEDTPPVYEDWKPLWKMYK